MQALYHVKQLRKCYGGHAAIDIDKLDIQHGTVTVLQGANGSGKSTLLSILAFLAVPTTGEIFFEGRKLDFRRGDDFAYRRQVTLLHQAPYLFKGSVADNVALGLRLRGMAKDEQRTLVEESLTMVGLAGFQERSAHTLSGGEAQRVALARALAMNPLVLLLDEPFSGVDTETAATIEAIIRTLSARGITIVVSSHDQSVAARVNGRIIRLDGGKLSNQFDVQTSSERLYATV